MEREKLEREIAETTRSLQRNIALLEEKTMKTVENVTDKVKSTADKIKSGARELSVSHQLEHRPVAVMAAAAGLGLITGLKLFGRRRGAAAMAPSIGRKVFSAAFSQAAATFGPMALGFAAEWVSDKIGKKKFGGTSPDASSRPLSESFTPRKVTGEDIYHEGAPI